MNFVAIDVETANADLSSICQVGIATFRDGALHSTWESLVNPKDHFDPINVSIHGIDESMVRHAPTWAAVFSVVDSLLRDNIAVSHTAFDRVAVTRACERALFSVCSCRWLDSARVVRRAWPMFAHSGYGLLHVAEHFGIEFDPHDALEDARCAGEILLRAIAETGVAPEQWLAVVGETTCRVHGHLPDRTRIRYPESVRRDANPDGPLNGEVIVFTGELSLPRQEAADAAARAGCRVDSGVTKHTTLLVVGDEDVRKLAGHSKSSKHRKAEELIAKGQQIRILSETDFERIVLSRAKAQAAGG